ncbi:hypothetical protein BL864_004961 [Escherichia coli]|nr:hypothetical protein [Escherichia coli]
MSVQNPFSNDPDRHAIWDMLMTRDFRAFAAQDWSMVAADFDAHRFLGVHAHFSDDKDTWTPDFPALEIYRDEWLRQAADSAGAHYAEPLEEQLLKAVTMDQIDIHGEVAIAHKKFDGVVKLADGKEDVLDWQTLYFCRKNAGRWQITGFVGYIRDRAGA